jgi:hypothetical protein
MIICFGGSVMLGIGIEPNFLLVSTRGQSSTYQAYVLCQDASNDPFNPIRFSKSQDLNNPRCEMTKTSKAGIVTKIGCPREESIASLVARASDGCCLSRLRAGIDGILNTMEDGLS